MYNNEAAIRQTLAATGCDRKTAEEFITLLKNGGAESGLKLLSAHRRKLLDSLHRAQKRIDCLDYFIYLIKSESE